MNFWEQQVYWISIVLLLILGLDPPLKVKSMIYRAYSLQVDSKQIVYEKISVIYKALNIRLQPQKEPNPIPLTLPPRPFSAFIDPSIWPSRLHSILTMLIFLLSTISSNTNLQIVTNHRQTVEIIQKIINLESYKLDLLNKEDYSSLLKIFRGSIGDRKVTAKLDPELKAQKPLTIYNLDINPKCFDTTLTL
ncbi:15996_t:CDS:2 [Gigaspora rosea]|nr:15996_t:CDS:2 [Gigaspora rosea]